MDTRSFENRKKDHIQLSLESKNEAKGDSGLEQVQLTHEAFPELNFEEVSLEHKVLGQVRSIPLLVSSMTAGHYGAIDLNRRLATISASRGWLMGVGSQRRELSDPSAQKEWQEVRKVAPKAELLGNIGLSQLIVTETSDIQRLVDSLEATALFVHTNPLQECMQPEGTPFFKGGFDAVKKVVKELSVPVIVKETGCGFSAQTLNRLQETGVAAVDVSGYGGTHWGRIEGDRAKDGDVRKQAANTFASWGISTVESIENAIGLKPNFEVWASGGVRSGLDAAKLFAMGSSCVGLAKPILQAALESEEALDQKMSQIEYELKTALFCTGSKNISELQERGVK